MRSYNAFHIRLLVIIISITVFSPMAASVTRVENGYWPDNSLAAVCSLSYSSKMPLSVPRVLIADNNLPNGSILYSWDYADFFPDYSGYCNGVSDYFPPSYQQPTLYQSMSFNGIDFSNSMYPTNNTGVMVKLYFTHRDKGAWSEESGYDNGTSLFPDYNVNVGTEYQLLFNNQNFGALYRPFRDPNGVKPFKYSQSANHFSTSLRAELIKIGSVEYNKPLKPIMSLTLYDLKGQVVQDVTNDVIGTDGITFVAPACRLSSPTDYNIDMGRWVNSGPGSPTAGISLPAYGLTKLVDLNMECSGQVDSVQFRFEDAGSSPSSNKNISLYDSAGGNKIEGLEIEMRYGGSRVAVDNITKTDTGSKGAIKTNPQDLSFNSQDSATFGARFVQTAQIKKSGAIYTGPVTGKVNMYVTYN